jgi:hypothetical protein
MQKRPILIFLSRYGIRWHYSKINEQNNINEKSKKVTIGKHTLKWGKK